jgi:hypothetical protein
MNLGTGGCGGDQSILVALARLGQRPHGHLLLLACCWRTCRCSARRCTWLGLVRQQALRHADAARRVWHIDHRLRTRVLSRRGVHARAGRHQSAGFCGCGSVVFCISAATYCISSRLGVMNPTGPRCRRPRPGPRQNLMAGHHHAHVHHLEALLH